MPAPTAAGSIDALVSVDPRLLDAAALKQHLGQLAAARSTLAAAEATAIAEFDHRGCCVDGCKRRPRWCDAHHVVPYPNGPTNLANLVLLCKRHHRHVHAGSIKLLPGDRVGWIVSRPDGTPLRQRPPPHLAA